ncbi:MAG TPA: HNH endonuclease [Chloroflexota bacterium]|jgi:putative restriction endonuclease
MAIELDTRVRLAAFDFLRQQTALHGTELPREVLAKGFFVDGQRIPLLAPQGIFKPALLAEVPLSITTAPPSVRKSAVYDDRLDTDGVLSYRYRGTDPMHRDNVGLRLARLRNAPLVYFFGVVPGRYEAIWPVFVVGDDPEHLTFTVVAEDSAFAFMDATRSAGSSDERRRYITTLVQRRLHQQAFRARVLLAYRDSCGICRLRHRELLDAAHILPDRHPHGVPLVSNGLALCSLHHAAFDRQVMGVRPDLVIEVRADVLREADGPMLLHGLQAFQGTQLEVPRRPDQQPNREFLAARYEIFRKAS